MNKRLALTSGLILVYLLACWMVDLNSSTTVMRASGRSHHIEYEFFYNTYSFYRDGYDTYTAVILKYDRIYLLCISIVFLAINIFKRLRNEKK
ncbi:hypothetical protein HGI30_03770 [Paenibacillus albicereus]|uniref:Uncharacterized protein n=1 Tax=Paenibacillus albicereus TaxID=2726185 RepID=A0A6H2GUE1_9BACL|nr:hypothetical protein [Paenibacillus albicereus]QJC50768.1 hypothetical protein HGI30_03770 [Paenibacillus albicereus]